MKSLKQKLKSYLRKKLTSLLKDEFFSYKNGDKLSAEFSDFRNSISAKICEATESLQKTTLSRSDFDNFLRGYNQTKEGFQKFQTATNSKISELHNHHGWWINELFSHVGTTWDIQCQKMLESTLGILTNNAYNATEYRMTKKVVYTCLTGNYDNLPIHSYLDFDYDYICFTDNDELLKNKNWGAWKIKPLEFSNLDNTKNARWHKLHPHLLFSEYDESIWIDANIAIKSNWIFNLVEEKKSEHKILVPIHYEIDSIFDDIEFVVNVIHKESRENADRVINFLKENNFPENYGLNETNLIFRRHNDKEIINLMEDWWYFIENFSKRDQFSFSFVLWKHGIKPSEIAIPNLRPLANDFRIDEAHKLTSYYKRPTDIPEYTVVENDCKVIYETNTRWGLTAKVAGYVLLNDDFDVYFKANRYFYKADKTLRADIATLNGILKDELGFDIRIPFIDGSLKMFIVNHTKKEIYIREIK